MAYKQLKTPNLDPVIYVRQGTSNVALESWAGWCLAYVEVAFGTPRLYASAWRGWLDTQNRHTDRNFPRGVYFPIWFSHFGSYGTPPSYDNWGHVVIARVNDDGSMTIWSSPASAKPYADTYRSIEQVERTYSSKFVGWSEDVARTPVIEPIEAQGGADDMTIIIKPISQLNVHMKKPIQLFDFSQVPAKRLHNSGDYMELTQITNVIDGKAYYVPRDRAEKGELLGFWDTDVNNNAESIHDTQNDPNPGLSGQDQKDLETGRGFRGLVKGVE